MENIVPFLDRQFLTSHPSLRSSHKIISRDALTLRIRPRQPGIGPDLAILGNLRGQTVVEVGCGSGHNLAHLVAYHDATGIGADHDTEKIARARLAYSHLPCIRFILADAVDHLASTKQASIDICLSIFGAFSFTDPTSLLTVASRAIRPGGLLAVTMRADDYHDSVIVLRRR